MLSPATSPRDEFTVTVTPDALVNVTILPTSEPTNVYDVV